jgi:hypothetical protein
MKPAPEETIDVDTGRVEETQTNSVRGAAFERYVLGGGRYPE